MERTRRRRARRAVGTGAALLAALMIIIGTAGPVQAEEPHQTAFVYTSANPCVRNTAKIEHGDYQNGALYGGLQSWQRNYTVPPPWWECKLPAYKPAGFLALARHWLKWMPNAQGQWAWRLCDDNPFVYSPSWNYAISRLTHYVSPPCGNGDYMASVGT